MGKLKSIGSNALRSLCDQCEPYAIPGMAAEQSSYRV